eukprot:912341-Prymnesium_polylepis.1
MEQHATTALTPHGRKEKSNAERDMQKHDESRLVSRPRSSLSLRARSVLCALCEFGWESVPRSGVSGSAPS